MSIYKEIRESDLSTTQVELFKSQTLDSSSINVLSYRNVVRINHSDTYDELSTTLQEELQSNYNSLFHNFYLSGSHYANTESRYNAPYFKKGPEYNSTYPQYYNKFHTASLTNQRGKIYSIPQKYFGQYIKPGTFTLNDTTGTYPLKIKDDKYGNLYATNALITQSNNSVSSSENYVGNIFYRTGVAVLTTGLEHYSGSRTYSGLGTNFTMQFTSSKDVYVSEYSLTIEPNEFNKTNNPTAKLGLTGSSAGYLANHLTASGWTPYFNTIGFYDDDDNLLMKAKYPQNIKTRRDIPIILKVKMDW